MVKSKREAEFVNLISGNQGIIHKVCSMYANEDEVKADLFQEIVLQLWRAYGSYQGKAKITTWMYRVALNTAISGFRKQKRKPEHFTISDRELEIPQVIANPDLSEETRWLYKAIEQLSEVEKAIIMLHLEEHSYDEIADIIGITRTHVGVKINRIKEKLRKIMLPHIGNA
ncbi:MAG: sigma-70 family RNA polymerase sigma factor [Bacteroidia bacterium]